MPERQSYSINPDPYDQPWSATIGRRRTIDEGQPGVSNYTDDWKLSQPFNPDWQMALPDYGRADTQPDPYTSTVQGARTKLGQIAKSTIGEAAAGALLDEDPLLNSKYSAEGKSGYRQAGALAASLPVGLALGAGTSLVKGGMRAAATAEPAVARLLERGGSEISGTAAKELAQTGERRVMSSAMPHPDVRIDPLANKKWQTLDDLRAAQESPESWEYTSSVGLPGPQLTRRIETPPKLPRVVNIASDSDPHGVGQQLFETGLARREDIPKVMSQVDKDLAGRIHGFDDLTGEEKLALQAHIDQMVEPRRLSYQQHVMAGRPPSGAPAVHTSRRSASVNPFVTPDDVDKVPAIEEIAGRGWQEAGRDPQIALGASPKRTIRSAEGDLFMHKATAGGGHGAGAATESQINRQSTGWALPQIVNEEAGSRVANLLDAKTPIARQVAEGGSLQPYVKGHPFKEIWAGNIQGVSPHALDNANVARQMQESLPVDTLIRNSDPNRGNFMYDPDSGLVIPVDKGLAYPEMFSQGTSPNAFSNQQNLAEDAYTYGRLEGRGGRRGVGAWNSHLDENVGLGFIRDKIEATPESAYREALTPIKRGGRLSDADFDTLMRNFMQETQQLRPRMADWYRMHKP